MEQTHRMDESNLSQRIAQIFLDGISAHEEGDGMALALRALAGETFPTSEAGVDLLPMVQASLSIAGVLAIQLANERQVDLSEVISDTRQQVDRMLS